MAGVFWAIWGKDSKSKDLIKGTDYSIRQDRYEVLAINFEIIWDEKTI